MPLSPSHYVSQVEPSRRPLLIWLLVAFGSVAIMALIVGAPIALANGQEGIANTIYLNFRHLCHQIPERSFFIAGHSFAVCSRCTGLYSGFMVATLFYPVVKSLRHTQAPARKWLFLAAAPMAIDFGLEFLGVSHNTHFSRFASGALLGAVAVFYVMPGLMELALRDWRARRRKTNNRLNAKESSPVEVISTSVAPSDYSAPHRRI
jgi:uncharacterized membrane protein